ncbi:Far upstream element-binding protein 2 [Glycine max]|nr:Far upstream element-binding protein 2 [Glycine max]KAH1252600.1 Far upstream element-binding protein 2 [Glycine max]
MAEDYAPLKRKYEDQPSGIELAKQRANGRVGVIVGKGGETIKYLQLQSGAKIQITRDIDADPNSSTRMVELMGTPDAIASAEKLINEVLAEAESGGSGIVTRRLTGQAGSDEFVMKIPNNKVGLIIGKGGETIKNMQASTGARIQVILLHLPLGDTSTERTLKIDGTPEQIESAKQLVYQVISGENRVINPAMSGGYPQQGYQSRPPSDWAPPAPMQQAGYGYVQPGAYSGPSPQYNMPQ